MHDTGMFNFPEYLAELSLVYDFRALRDKRYHVQNYIIQ